MSGWRLWPLDALASVAVSTVDKKSYDDETPALLCNYTDVYYNNLITSSIEFMRATATQEQFERFAVRAGDVVITKDSETSDDIARPAYVPHDLPGVVYGYHLAVYRPFDWRYGKFLRYAFDSTVMRAELARRTSGVTRVGLSQDTLRNLRISAPGPEGAQQIADYLDYETAEIDAFIADLRSARNILQERLNSARDGFFGIWLTGAVRAELRQALFEVDIRAGAEADAANLLAVSISAGVTRRAESAETEHRADDLSRYKIVQAGELILNRMRAFQGAVGVASSAGITSPDYAVLHADARWLIPQFASELIKSPRFVSEIARRLRGIGSEDSGQVRTPRVSVADVIRIPTRVPPLDSQRATLDDWVEHRDEVSAATADIDAAIALAKERRAALITAAVAGQIDVTARHKPVVDSIQSSIEEAR